MFNPEGSDTGREWIEVSLESNEECVNLTGYKLFEENINHNIYAVESEIFCKQAIICNDPVRILQEYTNLNSTIKDENSTMIFRSTFSLSNTGEVLAIKRNSEFVDYMNYSLLLEYLTIDEGYSIEYSSDNWQESYILGGSPGAITVRENISGTTEINISTTVSENNFSINVSENVSINTTLINTTIQTLVNITFSENHTNENISTQDANTPHNTSSNTSNIQDENSSVQKKDCDVSLHITLRNESQNELFIHENSVAIKFYNKLEFNNTDSKISNYSIEYWVEDVAGNIIKSKIITNNQEEKSFTPKISETDKIFWIRNEIIYSGCNITKKGDKRMLLVRNDLYTPSICPVCECEKTECKPCTSKPPEVIPGTAGKTVNNTPTIKIVNVCNNTKNGLTESVTHTDIQTQAQATHDIQTYSDNNSKKGLEGLTTGMIVYESPNLKNRFYSVIGLMLVGLALIILSAYRWYVHRTKR
jgi:hypothetical protein